MRCLKGLLLGLVLCSTGLQARENVKIVCTIPLLKEWTYRLLEGAIEVESLIPTGVDPHSYMPRPGQWQDLSQASLIIAWGLELESHVLPRLRSPKLLSRLYLAAQNLPTKDLLYQEGQRSDIDPHVFHDPRIMIDLNQKLAKTLSEKFPALAPRISRQVRILVEELREIDQELAQNFEFARKTSPLVLASDHDAFRYLGRRYQIELLSLHGLNPIVEKSHRELRDFVTQLKVLGVRRFHLEQNSSPRVAAAILEAGRDVSWPLELGEALYPDGPGIAGSAAPNYREMMRYHMRAILRSFGRS